MGIWHNVYIYLVCWQHVCFWHGKNLRFTLQWYQIYWHWSRMNRCYLCLEISKTQIGISLDGGKPHLKRKYLTWVKCLTETQLGSAHKGMSSIISAVVSISLRSENLAISFHLIYFMNTLRPTQNDHQFADDTFKRIFSNEIVRVSNTSSLSMRQSIIWTKDGLVYWRIYASFGINKLSDMTKAYLITKG